MDGPDREARDARLVWFFLLFEGRKDFFVFSWIFGWAFSSFTMGFLGSWELDLFFGGQAA